MDDKILDECIKYFKSDKSFKKIMTEIRSKYKSLGTFGGSIDITKMSESEKNSLSGLIGSSFSISEKKKISIKTIINSLEKTKFSGVDFYDVMCGYFDENITANKEQRLNKDRQKEKFLKSLSESIQHDIYVFVSDAFVNKTGGAYTHLYHKYKEDNCGEILEKEIIYIDKVIEYLTIYTNETKKVRLAILAANITGDPHVLDEGTYLNKLLTYYLCYKSGDKIPQNAEEKNYLYYKNGIMKDDISNSTLVAGIDGFYDEACENVHEGWKAVNNLYEPFTLSTYNILIMNSMKAIYDNTVYIFENPTVFMKSYEDLKKNNKKASLICSNGQVNTSTLLILDMLKKSGCKMYYSGDFDPEGLTILNKLLIRYGENIEPFHYKVEDYLEVISNKDIDDRRLKQLDKIKDDRLISLINKMKEKKKSGYQENIKYNIFDK